MRSAQYGVGGGRDEDDRVCAAVLNSLLKAHELGYASIALPAISSGIFGLPKERCASFMVATVLDFCARYPQSTLRLAYFTNIDLPTAALFAEALNQLAGKSG